MSRNKMNEKGIPYGAREKMPFWYSLAWSTRGASNALNVVLVAYITFYCTDILGLKAGVIGTLLLASKIIDAFTDLGVGYLIDRTHTRFGKARPYEIFIVFDWIFTILLFNVPGGSQIFQYAWVFMMYIFINAICRTALGGVDSVYMARTFTTAKNRINAMTVNGIISMATGTIFGIVAPQLIQTIGTTKAGWRTIVFTMAIPAALIGMLRFVFCKEVVVEAEEQVKTANATEQKLTMKEMLRAVSKNKYIFIVVGMMMITFLLNNMSAATTYYFKYIVGNIGLQSLAGMASMATPVIMILFPILSRKIGTTKILQSCVVIGIVGIVIRTIGGTNMTTILIGCLMAVVGTMPISMMINTYLIDCMDYGEWKTGIRVEGLIASVANFAGKLGEGSASGLIGLVMGLAGYNGMLEMQSDMANMAIIGLFNWLPLVLFVVLFFLTLMYKVDKIRPQMDADLKKKHEEA